MDSFEFRFDEIPILTDGDKSAGLISGSVYVNYYDDGEFYLQNIYLDGFTKDGHATQIEIEDRKSWLYVTIYAALDSLPWSFLIQEKVMRLLDEEGHGPRSDYQQHSTLHRAGQGV